MSAPRFPVELTADEISDLLAALGIAEAFVDARDQVHRRFVALKAKLAPIGVDPMPSPWEFL